jgi:hypothetical protein
MASSSGCRATRRCDHEQVRGQRQLGGVVAFDQLDAGAAQLVAHRRIDVGIAAGDLVAGRDAELGEAAHEGAADAENVDMHAVSVGVRAGRGGVAHGRRPCIHIPARVFT